MKTAEHLLAEAVVLQESGAQKDEVLAWFRSIQADALRHALIQITPDGNPIIAMKRIESIIGMLNDRN